MSILAFLFDNLGAILAGAGALAGGLWLGKAKGKKEGRKEAATTIQKEVLEERVDDVQRAREIENEVNEAAPDKLTPEQQRMRDKYGNQSDD